MSSGRNDLEIGYDVPAAIGDAVEDIQTPALVIDLDAFERNVERMRCHIESMDVRLRAHAKTHKSADIALFQIAKGGACGVCCQKVSEAEALVRGGVRDILVSNQVTGPLKVERLARLAGRARIIVCVDDATNVAALSKAAQSVGSTIEVLVEIDCGARRCGVQPGVPAADLARCVAATPNLVFSGLQAYHGSAQHIVDPVERRAAIASAIEMTRDTVRLLAEHGLECAIVGGAGTGSFDMEGCSGVYNELQCGSYIFMDADYGRVRDDDGGMVGGFEHALFVLTSVMSKTAPTRAVCDAGLKALAVDSGLPLIFDRPGIAYAAANDEHGKIDDPGNRLAINDRLLLVPGHCDPTCNLHDWFVGVRNGKVETLWPVTARGKLY
ncbi:DSD1 family PLP-dependent enzyme [Mesorhizobium sp.]|uniref:DSD1 family PLP-dependent enzyme n=1 Tax=Mesorhizobium sp. TaxID=1871066 RepID=UPI001209FF97|nr:DSD1 family PLP-dependent enzyme [Mesorhizobium sp.]TIO08460.1 MAG: DSD1 family PLP-dependent enzyme [Mesorhizobium sp.]TIO33892.1 MAG: DSD1 family PLP-dependent enzyme [Mesorhizobium sp.]TIP13068.1 MAG: DSD1 family PLP-dependent enzyme [Mesorhizobium sp.]